MRNWTGKIAAIALILLLPVQGAVAAASLPCFSQDADSVVQSHVIQSHAADHHAGGATHNHDESAGENSNHLGCHLAFSGVIMARTPVAAPEPSVYDSSHSLLAWVFYPEQPQRPPRH